MTDCIFCKIATGEIPAQVVYENDYVIAFEDLEPQMPVHTLIIPKEHYEHIGDNVPADILGHVFGAVQQVAEIKQLTGGYRIISNTGDDACQSVHHLHVHVLGGEQMNSGSPKL
ncbi:MAG: histidine triad nucleotide-binding protein [Eggerthellaceae bacterium]|nr:histidine triad nucleotide-binding protein [Eggerthellaceae bacterium]